MENSRLLEIFKQFLGERTNLGVLYKYAEYNDFLNDGKYPFIALPYIETAREHIRELANSINEFCYYLHGLTAWGSILDSLGNDRFETTFEFVVPISVYCLGAPYSLKGKFCTSIAELSHQANRFNLNHWQDNANLKNPNFSTAEKHAKHWALWSPLADTLSHLNDQNFKTAVDDFRNKFNHGYPRRLEFGLTGFVHRKDNSNGSVSYDFGTSPPLYVAELNSILSSQYSAALECYRAYLELVKEQKAKILANQKMHADRNQRGGS